MKRWDFQLMLQEAERKSQSQTLAGTSSRQVFIKTSRRKIALDALGVCEMSV